MILTSMMKEEEDGSFTKIGYAISPSKPYDIIHIKSLIKSFPSIFEFDPEHDSAVFKSEEWRENE